MKLNDFGGVRLRRLDELPIESLDDPLAGVAVAIGKYRPGHAGVFAAVLVQLEQGAEHRIAGSPDQFDNPVHAARVSNDGLVYVSDRGGKRVQVFTLAGKYVAQVFIGRECKAPECGNGTTAASTAFSTDPEQRFLYVGNRSQAKVMVLNRRTLEVLDSFGQWGSAPGEFGTLHHMAADSKGNLYVTEVTPLKPENRRIQKFTFLGLSTPPK